jgi:hypothetical protein
MTKTGERRFPQRTGMNPCSWNTHAILTRAALDTARIAELRRPVPVAPLENFLAASGKDLSDFVQEYWSRIPSRRANGVSAGPQERITDLRGFLKALRLNPGIQLHLARLLRPEEVNSDSPHDASRKGPPGGAYVPTAKGEPIEAAEIVATFSDEPDWGMDQELFSIPEYQYGPCPFPVSTGASSQAPFHMAFFHESPILRAILPGLRVSFMQERIRLFFGVSKLAFRVGCHYWGWRFLAWAMHYLQDLTQPYHARPFPLSLRSVMRSLLMKPYFRGIMERQKNFLINRHLLFEAAFHFLLNDAAKNKEDHVFFASLRRNGEIYSGALESVMFQASKAPRALAKTVDRLLEVVVDFSSVGNPYDAPVKDRDFHEDLLLSAAAAKHPDTFQRFLKTVGTCLEDTGKVSRYAVSQLPGKTLAAY